MEPFSQIELQLAARNHGMPLEALRYPVTPVSADGPAAVDGHSDYGWNGQADQQGFAYPNFPAVSTVISQVPAVSCIQVPTEDRISPPQIRRKSRD